MRFLTTMALALSLTGCLSVPRAFLEGEQAAYDAIAPIYSDYVDSDVTLSPEERDTLLRTVRAWKFALDRHAEDAND